jgi:c-di-GMP-binding flagellar brake protein YcgR
MFSLTTDCQRNAFRINPSMGLKVKISDGFIPIIDISINGFSLPCGDLNIGDVETVFIQLGENFLIQAKIEVIHLSSASTSPVCGCQYQYISNNDREIINNFILQQQKTKLKQKK